MQDNNIVNTNVTSNKGMVKDLNESLIGKDILFHARNAVMNSHLGDLFFYSNEPANKLCCALPYPFNGSIPLKDKRHLVFTTDNISSEIGIVSESICTYTKVVNDICLNFNLDFPIYGRSKENDQCEEVVTFINNHNPIRRLNLSKIPLKYTTEDDDCKTKVYTKELDCEALNLFKNITIPEITVSSIATGNVPNGMYEFVMDYVVDGEKYSDYYGLTLPQHIFDQSGAGGGFSVKLDNLDLDFPQYRLIMVGTVKGITTPKLVGTFSTSQSHVSISNFDFAITIPLADLVITKRTYEKAGIISGNSQYLILADLTQRARLNYQKQAFDIQTEYVVRQYPANYYKDDGRDIGYYRDEVHPFNIQWLYPDGVWSEDFTIAGRIPLSDELSTVSGVDIFEFDNKTGVDRPEKVYKFQAFNTAQKMVVSNNNPFINGSREYGHGFMAYHQSTELYPDNKEMFGDFACTPIRHHKFPDEGKCPRYSMIKGEMYINVLGIRFKNIPHPLDENGNKVNVIGYRIIRGDRAGGNRTVVARGMLTNVRGYVQESAINADEAVEVMYSNYPYNSLEPDTFFSNSKTINRNGNENNYSPLTTYYKDRFNFYTPHAYFNNKYRMGREFIIETEEIATIKGNFAPVYAHPKEKLLTNFSLYFAILAGVIEGYIVTTGTDKTCTTQNSGTYDVAGSSIGAFVNGTGTTSAGASIYPTTQITRCNSVFAKVGLNKNLTPIELAGRAIIIALQVLATAGMFIYASAEFAANALRIILGFSGFEQYAYQYNSHGVFSSQLPVLAGNKRRYAMKQPEYMTAGIHSVGDKIFNNYGKQDSIYIEFNKEIKDPKTQDTTRKTMSQFGVGNNPEQTVNSVASAFYATSKIQNPSQYGQLDSFRKVKTSSSHITLGDVADHYTSPTLFGGDCIIQRMQIMTRQPIFQQDIANENNPPGLEFNYSQYRNIAYPRFWADFVPYQIGDLITKSPSMGKLPAGKYNLDVKGNATKSVAWVVQGRYFYLSVNGVLDFFVEADYNISFREKVDGKFFYSQESTNLQEIFRSDRLKVPEVFKLDESFKKLQAEEFYSQQQSLDYDPTVDTQCKRRDKNALIYSLPSFKGTKVDNWQYFLPNNFFSFNQNDFGNLTTIKQLDQDRVIFLFDKSSPYVSFGQDELQTTDGRKVTIGDGGLFARPPREIEHTDVYYGNSKSRDAFVSTQFGHFYPSFSQGRILMFDGRNINEIQQGMHFWCQQYMPIQLYTFYPNYPQIENAINRVGYFTFFDNASKTIYITKRDFIPKPNYLGKLFYNSVEDRFTFNGVTINLRDENYFEDVSWTLSYSPENKTFISFHDWHPDGVIQTENHFMTVKDNKLWKHNERYDLYCNFYGKDYPFELEYASSTGKAVHIVNSIEYISEIYKYKNGGMDKFHVLTEGFDRLIVHNSEQASGVLNLVRETYNPRQDILFPKKSDIGMDILYKKVEQKYRINQFTDLVRDRGMFSGMQNSLFLTHASGYKKALNSGAINYDKPSKERKRFRHYTNFFLLSKLVSGANKFIVKFFDTKLTPSSR